MTGDKISPKGTDLTVEMAIEIIINGQVRTLIMFTPLMAREMVVGYMLTEGLINSLRDILQLDVSLSRREDGEAFVEAQVLLSSELAYPKKSSGKRVSYSSCGICGTENYDDLKKGLPRVKSRQRFSLNMLLQAARGLKQFQPLYKRTGGVHAAVLFDAQGSEVFHSEDMGRHNALDKVIGHSLLKGISPSDKALVSSGRASLEMILKTARGGFPLFVAMSRPTSKAVEAAKFFNITLVDFARDTHRIYTHVRRIKGY